MPDIVEALKEVVVKWSGGMGKEMTSEREWGASIWKAYEYRSE